MSFSHNINLVAFKFELARYLFKCLVEHFIDSWRSTNPNFLNLTSMRHKLVLDVLRCPSGQLWAICLRKAHNCFEAVTPEHFVDVFQSFDQFKTNRLLTTLESDVKVQLEARLVEIANLGGNILLESF